MNSTISKHNCSAGCWTLETPLIVVSRAQLAIMSFFVSSPLSRIVFFSRSYTYFPNPLNPLHIQLPNRHYHQTMLIRDLGNEYSNGGNCKLLINCRDFSAPLEKMRKLLQAILIKRNFYKRFTEISFICRYLWRFLVLYS